jgi:hypothetical protein
MAPSMMHVSRAVRAWRDVACLRRPPCYHRLAVAIYIGALLFGGVLILASVFGAGEHGVDAHGGGDGADAHGESAGHVLFAALFGIRFWSFGAAFFGLTGLLLRALGGDAMRVAAPVVGAVAGVAAGLAASFFFRRMTRESVGRVGEAAGLVGREGRLLLPVARGQQGKLRLAQPAGGHIDLIAQLVEDESDTLAAGSDAIVVEVRGTVVVVARAPAARNGRS